MRSCFLKLRGQASALRFLRNGSKAAEPPKAPPKSEKPPEAQKVKSEKPPEAQKAKSEKSPEVQTAKSEKPPEAQKAKSEKPPEAQKAKSEKPPEAQKAKSEKPTEVPQEAIKLPKLPVPQMHRALMHDYLMSVRPFLNSQEFAKTEEIVTKFGAPGGCGEFLHGELVEKASKVDNWLKDWWLNAAYLDFRAPVVVFSSPAQVFPKQQLANEEDYLKCVTNVIKSALEFKGMIDTGAIPQEKMGKDPLDMVQYTRIFGTTRIPCSPKDSLSFNPKSKHIIVMCHDEFFKMTVLNEGGAPLSPCELMAQVSSVISSSAPGKASPVGVLTSDSRDNWSKSFHLLYQDCTNKPILREIEDALFVVCLDLKCPPPDFTEMNTSGLMTLHGGGPCFNGNNRWYDKTLQFIIGKDGSCGICYEHSPAEAGPVANLADFIVERLNSPVEKPTNPLPDKSKPVKLTFSVNPEVKKAIDQAQKSLTTLLNDLEINCFSFTEFGKECIKHLKVSPDSFIQLAIQYAFVRLHKEPGAQYESGSLRKFKEGRTETIRSCTTEAIRCIEAMKDNCMPVQSKANALRLAINYHKDLTVAALNGRGIDRYLLGLRMLAKEKNMAEPEMFSDVAFKRSTHFRLSTSQVPSKSDCFMVYGPVVPNGYGCCYNPRTSNINFGTSSFKSGGGTSASKFQEMLQVSLVEMKDILNKSPPSKL